MIPLDQTVIVSIKLWHKQGDNIENINYQTEISDNVTEISDQIRTLEASQAAIKEHITVLKNQIKENYN